MKNAIITVAIISAVLAMMVIGSAKSAVHEGVGFIIAMNTTICLCALYLKEDIK